MVKSQTYSFMDRVYVMYFKFLHHCIHVEIIHKRSIAIEYNSAVFTGGVYDH